jgi:hypothetical protein
MHNTSFVVVVALAAALPLAKPGRTQTASQPNMVLTIIGGAVTGHSLWTIAKQPLCQLAPNGSCSGNWDTLQIARGIASSLAVGAAATYFAWPHVGFHAEISYLGLPINDSCTGLYYYPDVEQRHQQICDNLDGQSGSGGAISLFAGVTVRAASRRVVSPYVRGSVGIVNLARSTVEVVGDYIDGTGPRERQIIADPSPRRSSPLFSAAAGFTSPVGAGYQFRLEVRDVVTSLERAIGPANGLAVAPIGARYYHHGALILGLDVVLERKRGRRY